MKLLPAVLVFTLTPALTVAMLAMPQESPDLRAIDAPAHSVWVDSLDLAKMSAGRRGKPGQSARNTPIALDYRARREQRTGCAAPAAEGELGGAVHCAIE